MSYEVSSDIVEVQNKKPLTLSNNVVDTITADPLVEATKKEYSIVGDALYASVNTEDAPQWLTNLVDATLSTKLDSKLSTLSTLNAAILQAIDEIQVAKNTYNEQINIANTIDSVVASRLATLNASVNNNASTLLTLQNTYASKDTAATIADTRIQASLNNGAIKAQIDHLDTTIVDKTNSLANSIDVLEANLTDAESNIQGTANAVDDLYSYVGITGTGEATGTGLLADLAVTQKQLDGVVDTYTGTYDVITYQDTAPSDGLPDPDSIELVKNVEPYTSWLPLEGEGQPDDSDTYEVGKVYKDTLNDKYYRYSSDGWIEVDPSTYAHSLTVLRELHVGDTYIKYEVVEGQKHYLGAFKFIRTAVDDTPPYSTDTEGFTWAKVTDTDSQNAFIKALQAFDLADNKRRTFILAQPHGEQDPGDLWVTVDYDENNNPVQVVKVYVGLPIPSGFNDTDWVIADLQSQNFIDTVYKPESTSLKNQIDGKIEYYFIRGLGTSESPFELGEEATKSLLAIHNDNSKDTKTSVIPSKGNVDAVLMSLNSIFSVTSEIRESFHGSVVYFPDLEEQDTTTTTYGFWYVSGRGSLNGYWQVITDTSIYKALLQAEKAQASADGVVVSYYGYESEDDPDNYTKLPEFADLHYWYNGSKLYNKVENSWSIYTAREGDTLKTVKVILQVKDEYGNPVNPHKYVVQDINEYVYKGGSWVTTTPNGIIATSHKYTSLYNYLTGPDGVIGSADSKLKNEIEVISNGAYDKATSNFSYNSDLVLNGVTYKSGFGIDTYIDNEGNHDSKFKINAEKLIFTNSTQSGDVVPFRIDASGPNPDIVFKGKVTFGNNQEGYIEEAVAAAMNSVTVGDKNINITDNIIPMNRFVLDDNNAGYYLQGGYNKTKYSTLDSYTETVLELNDDGVACSPYVDDMTDSYYYRFAIKGVKNLSGFKLLNIRDVDEDNVIEDSDAYVETGIKYYKPDTTHTPDLDPNQWYLVDGLITPPGNPSTGSNGYIRDINNRIIAEVQNTSIHSSARWLSLEWKGPCKVARIKLSVITADTITSAAATEHMVTNLYQEQQESIDTINNDVASIVDDDILSKGEKSAFIRDMQTIQKEKESLIGTDGVSGQADLLGLVTSYDTSYIAFKDAYEALVSYLNSLTYTNKSGVSVKWDTIGYDTPLAGGGTSLRNKVLAYNSAKKDLLITLQDTLKSKIDYMSSILGDPTNNTGEVSIDKGVINADALVMGKSLIDTVNGKWEPKAGASGMFLNNESLNIIVNGQVRVRLGKLDNYLPSMWKSSW